MSAPARAVTRRPVAYVVQEDRGKNVNGALEFAGSIEAILDYNEELELMNANRIMRKIRDKLQDFTEDDYLICLGNPMSIGVAFMIASAMTNGVVKALKWDAQERRYIPFTVDLNQLDS